MKTSNCIRAAVHGERSMRFWMLKVMSIAANRSARRAARAGALLSAPQPDASGNMHSAIQLSATEARPRRTSLMRDHHIPAVK
jgi:hypothetical protein